jgi:hypothetical protein
MALWLHNKQTLVPERRDVAISHPARICDERNNQGVVSEPLKYGSNNDDFFIGLILGAARR